MTVITEEYRQMNKDLHESREDYGAGFATRKWVPVIVEIANAMRASAILDYGCGKGALSKHIMERLVIGYDPAIEGKDERPEPADMVVCTDVLEHIEPDCLEDVLDDLKRCAKKGLFLSVATLPAAKKLSDGRNAHLIQEGYEWWLPKLLSRWEMRWFTWGEGEFAIYLVPRAEDSRKSEAA